jgi:hypothetical protein
MRFVLLGSLALVTALFVATVAFVPEAEGVKVPADFAFEQPRGGDLQPRDPRGGEGPQV